MSLKSLLMEDLLEIEESKNRYLVVSSAAPASRSARTAVSQSCPNLLSHSVFLPAHKSLPDRLCAPQVYGSAWRKFFYLKTMMVGDCHFAGNF